MSTFKVSCAGIRSGSMDWSPIWSAAFAAAALTAVANGVVGWWRHRSEMKEQRRVALDNHLRDAAVEFIAANKVALDAYGVANKQSREIDEYELNDRAIEERRRIRSEAQQTQEEAHARARNAEARLCLLSSDIYRLAQKVIAPDEKSGQSFEGAVEQAQQDFVDAVNRLLLRP